MFLEKLFWHEKSPDFGEIENIPTVVDDIKKDISELTSVTSTEACVHLFKTAQMDKIYISLVIFD